nr:hypothetical protein [Tanacetum cinerariifolium]
MAGRSTHISTANNTNPPNEIADEVARQLNIALPNLLTQIVQALRGNRANQRENHRMVGSNIDRHTTRFHELARLVPHMVTLENQHVNRYNWGLDLEIKSHVTSFTPTTIQSVVSMANRLTTNGQGQRQYVGQHPKCAKCNFHHSGNCPVYGRCNQVGHFTRYCMGKATNERPRPTCFKCGDPNHFRRNFLRMNQATTSGANCPNSVLAIEGNPNQGNNRNQEQGRAFFLCVAEAPQDQNVVTGTFSLNDHFAIVLFDSGDDYSFISTNFLPLKLEGHTFVIDFIPFGHGSFDMIVRMDWLSKLRAKIVCFEKIVQILLSNGDNLDVHGERPKRNLRQLKTMKVNEPKLKDILVVHDFPGVFLEDLSSSPHLTK